ncbi:MAG: hypothetical protein J6U64_02775 [Alphaproteobacteria bacterium]|jgi:hypothetical protein|nr:hypothetical protein [Alphaproteobacteria bacterium]
MNIPALGQAAKTTVGLFMFAAMLKLAFSALTRVPPVFEKMMGGNGR